MQGTSVPGTSAGPPRAAAAPAGIIEALGEHPLFAELPDDVLTGLAAASNRVELAAGDVLMSEDDAGDHAYLVVGGRFAVTVGGRLVGCPSRGDLIGEMALLVDAPRSATVTALRASVVIRIGGVAFTSLLASQPARQRLVSAQLVERLRRANRGPQLDAAGRVIAVVTEAGRDTAQVARDLGGALARAGRRSAQLPVGAAGVSSAEVTILELGHDVVLLRADPGDAEAIAAACGHADRVLVVVGADSAPRTARELRLPARMPPAELVIVHPTSTACPRGTHRWLSQLHPAAHHHVRAGEPAHLDRVARRLAGSPVGLVLSGGGARGLAHVGTYRAMVETGVPADVVAGVSSGSIFALAIARGWDPDHVASVARRLLVECRSPVDTTLPAIALASGRRINERIREAFGDDDLRLEDLWLPTLILSTNLTTADVHEHVAGPAWRAVRASVAIPGVFPPMCEPEGLLVDGGLLDNLPVTRLRAHHPTATVIASDVGRRVEFRPDGFPPDGEISGWAAIRLRRRRRAQERIPGVVGLLGRLTALGGAGIPAERGDVHIDHELAGVGMFDFAAGVSTMEAGHRRAREVLAGVDASLLPLAELYR